ncbi:MAG: hypothetical protein EA345_10750 [Halomonas sp.]|nr:hypothetical protein [Halomonas sp.]TVP47378.1 MAG: hypothetical protein EA345_10750 [Halomonas sp.]
MATDHSRRGLLKVATLTGIGVLLLPGTALRPVSQAAADKATSSSAPLMVNGWLLKASDR